MQKVEIHNTTIILHRKRRGDDGPVDLTKTKMMKDIPRACVYKKKRVKMVIKRKRNDTKKKLCLLAIWHG